MELRQLEAVFWVATLGSFSDAAERLHLTQPAVSARISTLEQELGVTIFERLGRHVQLTPKGRDLFDQAKRLLDMAAELYDLAAAQETYRGILKIGATSTVACTWLPDLVRRINQAHPAVNLEIELAMAPDLASRLRAQRLDLIIANEPVEEVGLASEFLTSHSMDWVAHPDLQLPDEPVSLAAIAEHVVITYSQGTASYNNMASLFRNHGEASPRLVTSDSTLCIMSLLESGIGIATLPAVVVTPRVRAGQLRLVRAEVELQPISLFISYRTGQFSGLNRFVAAAAKRMAQGGSLADP